MKKKLKFEKKVNKSQSPCRQQVKFNVYQILPVGDKSIEITEKKVNKSVYGFAKENKITTPVYHQLKCDKAVTPKLYHRIDSHIQKPFERKSHFDLTKKTLTLNGFPARFTHLFSKSKTDKPASTQLTFSGFTTLPYIKGVSDKI